MAVVDGGIGHRPGRGGVPRSLEANPRLTGAPRLRRAARRPRYEVCVRSMHDGCVHRIRAAVWTVRHRAVIGSRYARIRVFRIYIHSRRRAGVSNIDVKQGVGSGYAIYTRRAPSLR